ncbi:hypothetical protein N752_29305 [Desulforamulus aquiferis]|nr:hypothetical protein N752_29305 [Desulforamulus aquiferis]
MAWLGFWGKIKLLSQISLGIFSKDDISEEELEQLKTQDMLDAMLNEFSHSFPDLKTPLIDERDQYLSQKIKEAPGNKVVAVVGAAHVPGIKKEIDKEHDLKKLNRIPPKSKAPKIIAWSIPLIILGIIGYTFYLNPIAGYNQAMSWLLWNGLFAAIGAAIACGHPLAIMTAFLVAPFSSLNPLLAAGWFSGLVQAYIRRPKVEDFESLADDVISIKGFWTNKVTRILLIVVFTNLGSTLGTFVAGANIFSLFIKNM